MCGVYKNMTKIPRRSIEDIDMDLIAIKQTIVYLIATRKALEVERAEWVADTYEVSFLTPLTPCPREEKYGVCILKECEHTHKTK